MNNAKITECQKQRGNGATRRYLPVQTRLLPVPELIKPSTQAHVDDPEELVLPYGQAVHDVEPAALYVPLVQTGERASRKCVPETAKKLVWVCIKTFLVWCIRVHVNVSADPEVP